MKSSDRWASQYAQGMADWSFGHACYHRTSSKDVKPGSVGYFDRNGNWKKILSLHDVQNSGEPAAQGISKKFTRLAEPLTVHDDVEMEIGTLTSSQTVSTDAGFKIEVQVDTAMTPINVGTDNAYRNSNTLGAVLVMKNPVVRSSIEDGDFLDRWFKENQRLFPEIRSAVREHGVWLVTTTYTTEEIALNVWQDKDKVVKLGFSAGIDGIVNLEPSIERGEKKHADGSFTYRAKSDERLVSFVGGIRFHYRSYVWTTGKLEPGVAYVQDPRTYHVQTWTEAERVGTEAQGKHVEAQKSGKGTVTKDTEAVHGVSDEKDAELNMKQTDEDSTSESSARPEVETDDDALQDKEDEEYSLTDAVHDGNADRVRDALGRKSEDISQKEDYNGLLKDACAAGYADIVDLLIKAGADTNALGGCGLYTPLIAASKRGHARVVQALLGAGADPDVSDGRSNALFAASEAGHDDIVLWLLAAGADVDQLASRTSALQVAAEGGHDKCVRWLIAAGADVDQQHGGTALHRATRKGYLGIIQQLLVAGADVDLQEERGEKREEAPLHAAAGSGSVDVVECLLNAGADVNAYGGTKKTPIAVAAASGCVPVVKLLLDELEASGRKRFGPALAYAVQHGHVEVPKKEMRILSLGGIRFHYRSYVWTTGKLEPGVAYVQDPRTYHVQTWTEAERVGTEGYADIVDLLIKAGADTNALGGCGLYTPLIAASKRGHARVVQALLGAGADPDVSDGRSNALFAASEAGHDDIVLWLLAAGADVDQLASRTSALQVAAEGGHDKCVRWLIAAGADVDQQHGGTALHRATRKGYLGIIQQLLVAGADVDLQEERGEKREEAPLHAAAGSGSVDVVECLLNAGADVNAYGGTKKTPIAVAAASGCVPVVKLLLDELEASGRKRFGPALAYAVQHGHVEVVSMLLTAGASPGGDPEEPLDYHSLKPPLIIAAQEGNEDLVTRLIKAGANVNQFFSQYGRSVTSLYAASLKGHLAIMRQLLDAGADIDGKAGYLGTPLLAAVSEGQVEAMTLLLDAGADLQARSTVNKFPALVVALDKGHPELVDRLINAGANVNDSTEYYGSALQAAAFKGYRDVAEKLLDVGADPAMEGGRYGLAIVAAAAKQHDDVVKMFVDRRAVTKEQAKKAKDRVEEMIESGDERSDEFHEILEMLSSVL
ncbi:Ankyrin-2 [Fusarium odoratissimum]|uniref:Ankyrin-2 n=1 Tax=Fusarium oxysporum f. sp. cubense (strain race 4) TaxID=2502994 RepID=N1RF19_FUSC4|nr:Ankyrin-2 [Fusarium odoratissimum]